MKAANGRDLKTVWILGAGFSHSLGGPLMGDLLRPQHLDDLRLLHPKPPYEQQLPDLIYSAQRLFAYGKDTERQWRDAEEYLAFLEDCATKPDDDAARQLIALAKRCWLQPDFSSNAASNTPAGLALMAKRALAAECCMFVRHASPSSEHWRPYIDWLARLCATQQNASIECQHTIVTFNYDTALEVAAQVAALSNLSIVANPGADKHPKTVPVPKIHGSVNWVLDAGGGVVVGRPDEALHCDGALVAMGVPGPAKESFATKRWGMAVAAILQAEAVVFLGYRFPETDADSRTKILTALAQNRQSHVAVHVVLGPDLAHRDPQRVRMLLATALGRRREDQRRDLGSSQNSFSLELHPLFAEDFLCLHTQVGLLEQERDFVDQRK